MGLVLRPRGLVKKISSNLQAVVVSQLQFKPARYYLLQ